MKKKEELSWAEIKAMFKETRRQIKDLAKESKYMGTRQVAVHN
jgi:hypothetical protein